MNAFELKMGDCGTLDTINKNMGRAFIQFSWSSPLKPL